MRTILIIDDDIAIGNMEQEVLERAGYATRRAYSVTEALLVLKTMRPDLILLDLMLPGLSGEEISSHVSDTSSMRTLLRQRASSPAALISFTMRPESIKP